MLQAMIRGGALPCLLGFAHASMAMPITIEAFSTQQAFEARLGGNVNLVDFESIDTSMMDPAPFAADRFKASHGVTITGEEGQFVSRDFSFPADFPPVSGVNMYAPGPRAPIDTPVPAGGNRTRVDFFDGDTAALVSGFGVHFIDADFPNIAQSGFSVRGANGAELFNTGEVSGANAEQIFVGLVAIDEATGSPTPIFSEIEITNGAGWPATSFLEGVPLDDFVFATPEIVVGGTPETPVIPPDPIPGDPTPDFLFDDPQAGQWFDPPFLDTFEYDLAGDASFTEVVTPPDTFGFGDIALVVPGLGEIASLGPGERFDFVSAGFSDVSSFRLTGIAPAVDSADPDLATAFPTFLDWDGTADRLRMTGITTAPVPIPATIALMLLGIALLSMAIRRGRESSDLAASAR